MRNILLEKKYLDTLKAILAMTLPKDAKVWLFGSRAAGEPKKFSDIDLAIDIGVPLSMTLEARLKEKFIESSLPYKVDIVDVQQVDKNFLASIYQQRIPVEFDKNST